MKKSTGTYVALLRGINVGGNKPLPMPALAALCEKAGCREVRTYIQSGNVVFEADEALAPSLAGLLQKAILKAHKIDVPVIVRSAAEMRRIAAKHPHGAPGVEPKALHVGFLAQAPSPSQVAALDPQRSPQDVFSVKGAEIYIRFALEGVAKSKLTNQYLDAKLGTVSTLRNWNTVLKLLELCDA
jgi:uncharacterized protein (DUF1697 family)